MRGINARAIAGHGRLASYAPLALLACSIVLMLILAWQTVAASRSHRDLAERVLQDYAAFAAVECVRRTTALLESDGFAVAIRALARADGKSASLPSRAALLATIANSQGRSAEKLVGTLFAFAADGSSFVTADGELPLQARNELLRRVQRHPASERDYRVIHPVIDRRMHVLVFTSAPVGTGASARHLGFEVPVPALAAWLREHVVAEPLLPPALAGRELSRRAVALVVRAPDGSIVFRSPDDERSARDFAPMVTRSMSGEARPGDLEDYSLQVAIAPEAAEQLIIGGLPTSRLAYLFALMALCTALAFVAAVQVRRERRHAQARQDFVTRASHELRTPVARIRVFAETLLLDRVRSQEERQEALLAMDRASRRLSLLIDNVLAFSRQDAGPPQLRIERVDLTTLTREVTSEFEASTDAPRGVEVVAPGAIAGDVDREAYRQVLLNLLDNASKYGGPARAIRVELQAQAHGFTLRVDDEGPGVPESDRERIWQAYVRLDRDGRSPIAGTGIGLAVVRDLVTRHGGSCDVQNAPRGGARFVVAFPGHPDATVESAEAIA